MKKIKVAVLMGGKSPEHEISILSGQQVVSNLNPDKYEVLPVVISKSGKWRLTTKSDILNLKNPIEFKGTSKEIVLKNKEEISETKSIIAKGVDVIFIAMHGPYGEDGTIQGMLELAGVSYTGANVLTSALCMDKDFFRRFMIFHKLPIPKYVVYEKGQNIKNVIAGLGKFPYFVKPVRGGSSVGSSICNTQTELKKSINLALKYDNKILIDEYLDGLEVTCAVIGNDKPVALPVIEIHPLKGKFFDYESKYAESGSEEIVPARISKTLTKKVQDLAIKVYKAVGCRGFGRVDFILKNNNPIVLEINTIPGLTQMSLLPKAARAAGMTYGELIDKIIEYATKEG